jgi:group I intron endonuclease
MIIYKITNLINLKLYIGQTKFSAEERWKQHIQYHSHEKFWHYPLYCAMRKYGLQGFKIEILDRADSKAILDKLEIMYIAQLRTQLPHGYNVTPGGSGRTGPLSEEAKRKMSLSKSGVPWTPQHRAAYEAGIKIAMTSDHWPEHCKKISEGVGKAMASDELREQISEGVKAVTIDRGFKPEIYAMRNYHGGNYGKREVQTVCKNGHQLTPDNLYINSKTGKRQCKQCAKACVARKKDGKTRPREKNKTHCVNGHDLSVVGVYLLPGGRWKCKECRREYYQRKYHGGKS